MNTGIVGVDEPGGSEGLAGSTGLAGFAGSVDSTGLAGFAGPVGSTGSTSSRAEYAPLVIPGVRGIVGGLIAAVDEGSPAERGGLVAGMTIIEVDGQPLRDVIDWLWLTDKESVLLTVRIPGDFEPQGLEPMRQENRPLVSQGLEPMRQENHPLVSDMRQENRPLVSVELCRGPGESWGIGFVDVLFDGLKTCCNNCLFCFMSMLPKGMRASLYVRDDDYRLSFLQGNFVTLTNMEDRDIQRVIEYRLSPLHVSLHAIDPELRMGLIGKNHARGIEVFKQLLAAGIEAHIQIVLVPGYNDGAQLEVTLAWIREQPNILSVGIVPYGYTKYAGIQQGYDGEGARAVIAQVERLSKRDVGEDGDAGLRGGSLSKHDFAVDGASFQLADEWFLLAGLPLPSAEYYKDFPQFENGVGMMRSFIDDWEAQGGSRLVQQLRTLARQAGVGGEAPVDTGGAKRTMPAGEGWDEANGEVWFSPVLITGEAFAPFFNELTRGLSVIVIAIRNDFFGGNVNITGLLVAEDIIAQLGECDLPEDAAVFIPDVVFNADGLTLDNYRVEDIARALGRQVVVVPCI